MYCTLYMWGPALSAQDAGLSDAIGLHEMFGPSAQRSRAWQGRARGVPRVLSVGSSSAMRRVQGQLRADQHSPRMSGRGPHEVQLTTASAKWVFPRPSIRFGGRLACSKLKVPVHAV